jgi:hypothetical protein
VAALEPHLGRDVELELVGEEPRSPPAADLHLYHVADDPAHGFVYRALLRGPGLVVLEDWGLHRLVHAETAGRGNEAEYRQEARRAHGELGDFVSRQVVQGSGGVLAAAVLTMNERVLDAGLGFVATSEAVQARVAARLPGRAVAHLPLAFQAPPLRAGRDGARAALRVPPESLLVVAVQPAAADTPPERVARALEEVREAEPRAVVRWTREDDPDLVSRLAAADVVVALEHPPRAGLGVAVPLAVAGGRGALVSAGSGAAREMPEGVVARVSPGPTEIDETVALVSRLLANESLRSCMGGLAHAYAAQRRDPEGAARALLDLLRAVERARGGARRTRATPGGGPGRLASRALDEIVVAARELGVVDPPPGLASLAAHLFGEDGP